jgi:hypothetical protein
VSAKHKAAKALLSQLREEATGRIKAMLAPHRRPTGFVDASEEDQRMRVALWKGWKERRYLELPTIESTAGCVWGFRRDGIITDMYGGGMATLDWHHLPLDDLLLIEGRIRSLIKRKRMEGQ